MQAGIALHCCDRGKYTYSTAAAEFGHYQYPVAFPSPFSWAAHKLDDLWSDVDQIIWAGGHLPKMSSAPSFPLQLTHQHVSFTFRTAWMCGQRCQEKMR